MNKKKLNKTEYKYKYKFLLVAIFSILSTFSRQSFGITSCNFPTKTLYESRVVQYSALTDTHEYKETTNVPKGNCDRLGALNDEVGAKECAGIASKKGYSCFQVEDMQMRLTTMDDIRGVWEMKSPIIRSCYACVGN